MHSAKKLNINQLWKLSECLNSSSSNRADCHKSLAYFSNSDYVQLVLVRSFLASSCSLSHNRGKNGNGNDKNSYKSNNNDISKIFKTESKSDLVKLSGPIKETPPPPPSSSSSSKSTTTTGSATVSGGGSGGKKTFYCPKCGNTCTNLHTAIAASRFVKCEKCNHFFVVMTSSDVGKSMNSQTSLLNEKNHNQQQQQQQAAKGATAAKQVPPPPPKKIFDFLNKFIVGQENAKKVYPKFFNLMQ